MVVYRAGYEEDTTKFTWESKILGFRTFSLLVKSINYMKTESNGYRTPGLPPAVRLTAPIQDTHTPDFSISTSEHANYRSSHKEPAKAKLDTTNTNPAAGKLLKGKKGRSIFPTL